MDAIMNLAVEQGFGYVLFVVLFYYVLKEQGKRDRNSEVREAKYQQLLGELTHTVSTKLDQLIERLEK